MHYSVVVDCCDNEKACIAKLEQDEDVFPPGYNYRLSVMGKPIQEVIQGMELLIMDLIRKWLIKI